MKKSRFVASLAGVGLVVAAVLAAQAVRVTLNGKPASARMIDGSVYVKLADVSKAFDMPIVAKNGGFDLSPAGGANQLEGLNGKIGQELFTGKWKLLVKDVQRVDKYMLKYAASKFELTADSGNDLIVVNIRFKSGVKESAAVYFGSVGNTALTDMEEHTYSVKWADTAGGVADTLLPGSAKDFALVFSVPKSAELKDLIYTIEPVALSKYGKTDLRISLKQ